MEVSPADSSGRATSSDGMLVSLCANGDALAPGQQCTDTRKFKSNSLLTYDW